MSEESLKKIEQLQREVTEAKGTIHHSSAISFFHFVLQFESLIGLGHPTTCGYQHVLEDKSITLHQYLIMQGLGSCVRLENYIGHHFYGYSFVHKTSFCVGIDSSKRVWVSNKNKRVGTLLGWGAGGKKKKKDEPPAAYVIDLEQGDEITRAQLEEICV